MLSYVQERLADVWKENVIDDLENSSLIYTIVREFLIDIKKEFGREDDEMMKIAELRKVEQGSKTIEEFVQKFRKVVKRRSKYEERLLIEEFKREINEVIRQKLMESECLSEVLSSSISKQ